MHRIRQSVVAPSVVVPSVVELNVVVLNAVVQSVVVPFAISLQRNGISAAFAYGECICHSLQRNGKACGECAAFARVFVVQRPFQTGNIDFYEL